MKNLFKLFTLFILAVLLVNCEAEKVASHSGTSLLNSKKISLQQFLLETKINNFDASIHLDNKLQNRTADGRYELTDFEIDTDLINRMEYNQKTTYSFVASPKDINSENYFNLIYYKKNNIWEMKIIELKPNLDNLLQLQNGLTAEFEGQMRMVYETVPTTMSQPCTYIMIPVERCQGCNQPPCDRCNICMTSMTYIFCNSVIEFISAPPLAPSGPNGADGGGGGANADPNEIVIDPNLDNLDFNKIILFLNNLRTTDLAAFNYFYSHPEIKNQVFRYLGQNAWSEESTIFANHIIIKMNQNPTLYTSIKPFLIEKNIDDSQLDPCSKGVFQQVKNTTNCDFANVLAKLDANGSVYNTTIKSAVAPSGKPVQTVRNSAYNYTIYISTDYVGETKLFIAASMFHELVHAYFMSLLDEYNSTNSPNPSVYNDFAILFQKFVDKTYPGSSAVAHHEQMATDYVNAIAAGLQEYQPGLPQQVYQDLAWGGLQEAPIFNTLFPVGSSDRERIINRYTSESQGFPYGQGQQAQTPIGQPCN
jgi:hypothetical protein